MGIIPQVVPDPDTRKLGTVAAAIQAVPHVLVASTREMSHVPCHVHSVGEVLALAIRLEPEQSDMSGVWQGVHLFIGRVHHRNLIGRRG